VRQWVYGSTLIFVFLISCGLERYSTVSALGNALIWGLIIGEFLATRMVFRQPLLGYDPTREAIRAAKGRYQETGLEIIGNAYRAKRDARYWVLLGGTTFGLFMAEQWLVWQNAPGENGFLIWWGLALCAAGLAGVQQTASARLYFRRYVLNNQFDRTLRPEDIREMEREIGGVAMGQRFWIIAAGCGVVTHLTHALLFMDLEVHSVPAYFGDLFSRFTLEGPANSTLEPFFYLTRFALLGSFVLLQVEARNSCERSSIRVAQTAARIRDEQIKKTRAEGVATAPARPVTIANLDALAAAITAAQIAPKTPVQQIEAPKWVPPLISGDGNWRD
jgi:hypothetical protein